MSSDNGIYVLRFVEGNREIFSAKEVSAIDNLDFYKGEERDKYVEETWGNGQLFWNLHDAMEWARANANAKETEYGAVNLGTYDGKVPRQILNISACHPLSLRVMMIRDYLVELMHRSSLKGGLGMLSYPDYYSGCGADTAYLDSNKLQKLYDLIVEKEGKKAGMAFAQMVQAIPVLTPTDFLLSLSRLCDNDFVFHKPKIIGNERGICLGNKGELTALCTIAAVRMRGPDRTKEIKGAFLARLNMR